MSGADPDSLVGSSRIVRRFDTHAPAQITKIPTVNRAEVFVLLEGSKEGLAIHVSGLRCWSRVSDLGRSL